ncbi:MAG: MTH938/NDUFAF3 family protein [Gammaproteobacteria bacterium]|nr:MTH938/NDUFAF3 family protein [Gammaproteobacteria bacterium]
MDITQDFADANFVITGYESGSVFINNQAHQQSLIISSDSLIYPWEVNDVFQLNETSLASILEAQPEILIIGTGETLILPEPKIIALFAQHQIGLETMNTGAACRTYGILVAEGRKATAGIISPKI